MLPHSTKKAEAARLNGAKSKGPKTPDGLYRCQTASYKHGLYAVRNYMLPGESTREYAEIQAQLHAYWQPKGFYDELLVEELTGIVWELKRLHAAKNDYLHDELATVTKNAPHCRDQAKLNLEAEKKASVAGGSMDKFNARIAHYARERHRLERELLRLEKRSHTSGPSQMSLKINGRQNSEIPASADAKPVDGRLSECPYVVEAGSEPLPPSFPAPIEPQPETAETPEPIVTWAAAALGFHPDPFQRRILEESNTRIMVLAPRQTGKSTAAVRVLYEAVRYADAVILLAGASSRQSGQILEKARGLALRTGLATNPPPPGCAGFRLANGSQVIALPANEAKIRGFSAPRLIVVDEAAFASPSVFKALEPMLSVSAGTIMLLSTPNGQAGYFYEQWHASSSPWTRLQSSLADCPRIRPEAVETMRRTMAREDFQQEFECKFVAAAGQFISRETFRQCLRDDFPLFFPEYDCGEE